MAMKAMKSATMEDTDRFLARWMRWNSATVEELEQAATKAMMELGIFEKGLNKSLGRNAKQFHIAQGNHIR